MTVDRSLYAKSFEQLPDWSCPTCGKGHLKRDEASFLDIETGPSKAAHDHDGWDPDWIKRRFAGLLTCDFYNCGEVVAISGSVSVDESYSQDYDGSWERTYSDIFTPCSIIPGPLPIRPPEASPENVTGRLREAASLLWQSSEAAANQVRQAVEYLMDERGVSQSAPGAYLSLHSRIKEFEITDPKNAEFLLAIKWLGNSGSHAGGLKRKDVLDAFDFVEVVLVNLYDTSQAEMLAKVQAINTNKGPANSNT